MDFNEALTFYSPTTSADGYGGTVDGWTEQFTARAAFRYLRGGETVQAARLAGTQPVVATVRASSDAASVGAGWKFQDRDGADYNIRSIIPTDDRLYYEITAERGVEV